MYGPLLFSILVAVAVLIGFFALWRYLSERDPVEARLQGYGVSGDGHQSAGPAVHDTGRRRAWPGINRLLAGFGLGHSLAAALMRADVPLTAAEFALVMAGLLLVTWQANRELVDSEDLKKGMFYGVASIFLMAVGVVMVKEILETRSFMWTVQLRLFGGVAGMLIYVAIRGRFRQIMRQYQQPLPWGLIVTASFLGSYLSMMMWLYSYKLIPASVSSVLNQSANAWMVLLAWLILHEYVGMRKIYGLLLTTAGVLVMLLA